MMSSPFRLSANWKPSDGSTFPLDRHCAIIPDPLEPGKLRVVEVIIEMRVRMLPNEVEFRGTEVADAAK